MQKLHPDSAHLWIIFFNNISPHKNLYLTFNQYAWNMVAWGLLNIIRNGDGLTYFVFRNTSLLKMNSNICNESMPYIWYIVLK